MKKQGVNHNFELKIPLLFKRVYKHKCLCFVQIGNRLDGLFFNAVVFETGLRRIISFLTAAVKIADKQRRIRETELSARVLLSTLLSNISSKLTPKNPAIVSAAVRSTLPPLPKVVTVDDMYNHACEVADGVISDDCFLPIIYELDRRTEWSDPAAWIKANPSLGKIKKRDDLQLKVDRAKQNPNDLSGVLCKEFNIRETVHSAWLSFDAVNNTETFDLEDFRGAYCISGADLSITTDLTCASLLFMKRGSDKKCILASQITVQNNTFCIHLILCFLRLAMPTLQLYFDHMTSR